MTFSRNRNQNEQPSIPSQTKGELPTEQDVRSPSPSRRHFLHGGVVATSVALATHWSNDAFGQIGAAGPRQQFALLRKHEQDHVNFLVQALGNKARPRPTFKSLSQPTLNAFLETSLALENTGSGAYLGAAPVIFSRDILASAGSIALTEARHIGFLNGFRSRGMTVNLKGQERSFESPLTIAEVTAAAGPFIASLNGGPDLTFDSTPSAENDIKILNFALALEYLEAEFYQLNVMKFFGV